MTVSIVVGEDGRPRCGWVVEAPPEMLWYHDEEWGQENHDPNYVFETISLAVFAAGIRFLNILRRRENYRQAFHGFDIARVAQMTGDDVDLLMKAGAVIRRRPKIEAVINNARAQVNDGRDISELAWSFQPTIHHPPTELGAGQNSSVESAAFAAELKSIGYKYVGPTGMYSAMETFGVVNDHIRGCFLAD